MNDATWRSHPLFVGSTYIYIYMLGICCATVANIHLRQVQCASNVHIDPPTIWPSTHRSRELTGEPVCAKSGRNMRIRHFL